MYSLSVWQVSLTVCTFLKTVNQKFFSLLQLFFMWLSNTLTRFLKEILHWRIFWYLLCSFAPLCTFEVVSLFMYSVLCSYYFIEPGQNTKFMESFLKVLQMSKHTKPLTSAFKCFLSQVLGVHYMQDCCTLHEMTCTNVKHYDFR